MKNYIQRNEINPGEYTEASDGLYIAVERDRRKPCLEQCDCNPSFGRRYCNGFCFRWDNDGGIVFKLAKEPKDDYTVVVTPIQKPKNINHA
jgi:hypothetical protein